jgi:hypothetical protein
LHAIRITIRDKDDHGVEKSDLDQYLQYRSTCVCETKLLFTNTRFTCHVLLYIAVFEDGEGEKDVHVNKMWNMRKCQANLLGSKKNDSCEIW